MRTYLLPLGLLGLLVGVSACGGNTASSAGSVPNAISSTNYKIAEPQAGPNIQTTSSTSYKTRSVINGPAVSKTISSADYEVLPQDILVK